MNVLITGGTGFIGSQLATSCLRRGDSVTILGQENTAAEVGNSRILEEAGAKLVLGSVTDEPLVDGSLEGIEIVFHLAAAQHEANIPDERFREVNVDGTRILLEASTRHGVRRFVHGSTIGVYGVPSGTLTEDTECSPDNIYGRTKLEGERLALSHLAHTPTVAVRIPEVYGPGDRRLLKLFRLIDKGAFRVLGSGSNLHHLIYIADLVDGLLLAAEKEKAVGQVFLLAGRSPVSTGEMVAVIAEELGRRPPRLRLPLFPFLWLGIAMETVLGPLGIQPPIHRRRLDFFRKSFTLSAARARSDLGFEPRVEFREGVRRTADFYRENDLL